jgi:hypothetical protein
LTYASLLGGKETVELSEQGFGIAVNAAGNAYITGSTSSADFPTTPNVFQRALGGNSPPVDGFVAKISPASPACELARLLPGPPAQLQVLVHADRGLSQLVLTEATNTRVALPTFARGSTDTFTVSATKVDQGFRSTFTVRATDQTGTSTSCDPALVTLRRAPGGSPVRVIHHVARSESQVFVTNGTPGMQSLRLLVNGRAFQVTGL